MNRRCPHGQRGLKFVAYQANLYIVCLSLPTRAAWIEIIKQLEILYHLLSSLPTRAAWIEIPMYPRRAKKAKSLPTRAAWIEMLWYFSQSTALRVAAHTGSVD